MSNSKIPLRIIAVAPLCLALLDVAVFTEQFTSRQAFLLLSLLLFGIYLFALARRIDNAPATSKSTDPLPRNQIMNVEDRNKITTIIPDICQDCTRVHELYKKDITTPVNSKLILDILPDPVWIKDCDGKYLVVNQTYAARLGFGSSDELLGKTDFEICSMEDAKRYTEKDQFVVSTKTMQTEESYFVHLDGTSGWYNIVKTPMIDDQGNCIGLLGTAHDISDRKRSEQLLQHSKSELEEMVRDRTMKLRHAFDDLKLSEERFRTIIQDQTEMICRFNNDGTYTFVNETFARFFGSRSEHVIGRNFFTEVDSEAAVYIKDLLESVTSSNPTFSTELPLTDHAGVKRWTHWTARGLFDDSDRLREVQAVGRDISDRVQAEFAVREKQQQIDQLIEHVDAVLWEFDLETYQYLFISRQIEHLLGYPHKDWTTNSTFWIDHIHPDDQLLAIGKLAISETTEQEKYLEYRMIASDGRVIWVLDRARMYKTATGNRLRGVFVDITQKKRDELVRNSLLEIMRSTSAIQSLEDMLTTVHQTVNTLMDASNFFVTLYDQDEDAYSFPYFYDPFDEPVPPRTLIPLKKSLTDYVRRTGQALFCDEAKFQELTDAGEVELVGVQSACWLGVPLITQRGVIGVTVAQTYANGLTYTKSDFELLSLVGGYIAPAIERKLIDEERARMVKVIESVNESILLLNMDGLIEYVNPAFERLTGFSFGDAYRQLPVKLLQITEENSVINQQTAKQVFQGKEWRGAQTHRTKTGEVLYVDVSLAPIFDNTGKQINVVAVFRNVTHEHALEDQLRQSQKMEAVGLLAGGIAHDFNNLLTAMMGNISLAMISPADRLQTCLLDAEKAAIRASEVVKQILLFSRRSGVQLKPVHPAVLLDENETILKNTIDRRIDVSYSTIGLTRAVFADASQIHQVLVNLCVNARDAIFAIPPEMQKRNWKITISACDFDADDEYCLLHREAKPGEYVRFSVSDTGIGMTPETLQRVFEPFFTTKAAGSGTGLGLASVYGIVKQHNGWLEVESEFGNGTAFSFYLPATLLEAPQAENGYDDELATGTETILLVDDEEMIRTLGKTLLEQLGYRILLAEDGASALEVYFSQREVIDLTILDYSMPNLSGGEVLQQILVLNPDAKVIMSSGYTAMDTQDTPDFSGAKGFVGKPYHLSEMATTIRKVLDDEKK